MRQVPMSFASELADNKHLIKSIYDLVAFSYKYLVDKVQNQAVFLGIYIDENEEADIVNPNLQMLRIFADNTRKYLRENRIIQTKVIDNIIGMVKVIEKVLVDYEEEMLCRACVPFFLLEGIDLYMQDCPYCSKACEPLNNNWKDCCLIYLNTDKALIDRVISCKEYPDMISTNEIRWRFKTLIIVNREEIPDRCEQLRLVTLSKPWDELESIVEKGKIRIAVIPVTKVNFFEFSIKRGAAFEVIYDKSAIEDVKSKIIGLLRYAIECEVNIVVFPEYVCAPQIQDLISKELQELSITAPEKLKNLLFVAAGSGWTEDSNNVGKIFNYDGESLGKEYKYSAYDKKIKGKKYVEKLMHPGKELVLVKIPQVGIAQFEICRNVSEGELSSTIAKIFLPQFLLISAWSSSLHIAFEEQIEHIIANNHKTCALVCNCCAAYDGKDFREEIAFAVSPQKNRSTVRGNNKYMVRSEDKCAECSIRNCLHIVCFDFNMESQFEDVEIQVSWKTRQDFKIMS